MHFVLLNIGWEIQTVVSERFEPGKYYIYIFFTLKDSSLCSLIWALLGVSEFSLMCY